MDMLEHRSLLLRSNRFLGSALVSRNLIKVEDLEAANQKLLEVIQSDHLKAASILNILLFDLNALNERDLINSIVEANSTIGLIDLRHFDVEKSVPPDIDLGLCWATWSLPFDRIDKTYFIATAYYLSAPTLKHWEESLDGNVVWYVSSITAMTETLQKIEDAFSVSLEAAIESEGSEAGEKKA